MGGNGALDKDGAMHLEEREGVHSFIGKKRDVRSETTRCLNSKSQTLWGLRDLQNIQKGISTIVLIFIENFTRSKILPRNSRITYVNVIY